jgi:hypothetical protein
MNTSTLTGESVTWVNFLLMMAWMTLTYTWHRIFWAHEGRNCLKTTLWLWRPMAWRQSIYWRDTRYACRTLYHQPLSSPKGNASTLLIWPLGSIASDRVTKDRRPHSAFLIVWVPSSLEIAQFPEHQSVPKLNDTAKLQKKVIRASNSFQEWILEKRDWKFLFFW